MDEDHRKIEVGPRAALYPNPVVLVTCVGADGRPNIITLAWVGVVCSEPPQVSVSIRPGRHSYAPIRETGEFVVNVPSELVVQAVDQCGMVSGREVSKFELTGLTPLPATRVKAPLIAECPVNLECVVRHRLALGTHDLFVGEVIATHVSAAIVGEKGRIDYSLAAPVAYVEGRYWGLGSILERHGFSR